ncbi:D-aspartate oxidase isoform X2 [Patella vulgata]|uniref:D-aspartate oxidase isoform X2 n=1 Tax=Patella vulgata TaxID=6465 RepID=UPI0024A852A0|nr:D-aspartate oxidase isoform X2 [Patella vulgata]
MKKICVVGAGIIGLSSAIRIQDRYPKIDITIIADKFSPNTTSDGAGALFEVFAVGDTPLELVQKWAKETWDHLKNVAFSVEADSARVQHVSGYWVTGDPPMTSETSPDEENTSRRLTSEEMQLLFPRAKSGKFFTSYLVDCTSYLPWLMKQYMNKGGKIINKTIQSLDELYPLYDIIINCSGLHSHQLLGDKELFPARGETIRVHAPWIKHFYVQDIGDEFTYIFPGSKNVVLGATFQKGNWNTKPNHEDRAALFERCCQIHPSLKMATVDYSWVGLRPCRSRVRLELEPPSAHTKCRVIHNYGHGGAGVTLHWGCAQTVVDLLRDLINNTYINSKL